MKPLIDYNAAKPPELNPSSPDAGRHIKPSIGCLLVHWLLSLFALVFAELIEWIEVEKKTYSGRRNLTDTHKPTATQTMHQARWGCRSSHAPLTQLQTQKANAEVQSHPSSSRRVKARRTNTAHCDEQ